MKERIGIFLTAMLLVALGFGLGCLYGPTRAETQDCISGGGQNAVLKCPGEYEFAADIVGKTDVTDCRIAAWGSGGEIYHSAVVTVVKK